MNSRQIKTIQHYFKSKAQNYLDPLFQIQTNDIENIWLKVVDQHFKTKRKLRLVIFAESPLELATYFYNNYPNKFLLGLRDYYEVSQAKLIEHLLDRDILIFELFKYPLESAFYKKHYDCFIDENHISSKLNLIKPLFDNGTRFVFRYKMLFQPSDKRMLHHLNAFDSHFSRFDLDGTGNPQSIFISERPKQIINPLVIPYL